MQTQINSLFLSDKGNDRGYLKTILYLIQSIESIGMKLLESSFENFFN